MEYVLGFYIASSIGLSVYTLIYHLGFGYYWKPILHDLVMSWVWPWFVWHRRMWRGRA